MKEAIKINYLDHVAIRVKDLERSANWYKMVLGLKKQLPEKWGAYPIFMLCGKTGVALFPANTEDHLQDPKSNNVKIDHFAFNVDREGFKDAIKKYKELGLTFEVKDHFYFDSIYTKDPDGHTVELITIKVEESTFYK